MSAKTNPAKRIIATLLAAIMVVSMLPLSVMTVFAAGPENYVITVTSDGITPIDGAYVKITAGGLEVDIKDTTATGSAEFALSSGTEYAYTVEKIGYNTASGIVDMTTLADTVTLSAKATVTVIGHVENAIGTPIENASIAVTGYATYNTSTSSNGDFSINGVYEGESYSIVASYTGYKTVSKALSLTSSNDFVLSAKETSELTFEKSELNLKYGTTGINVASCLAGSATKYESLNESIATVNPTTGEVTPAGIGSAIIRATINESDDYLSDTAEYTVTVEQGEQSELVWNSSVPMSITWNQSYTNTVSGGTGAGTVTYQSNHDDIASVDENTGALNMKKPGVVRITATKVGGTLYTNTTAYYDLTIVQAEQSNLMFTDAHPSAIYFGNNSFVNAASGGSTSETIEYSSSDTSVANVDSTGKLTVYKYGDVTITAKRPGNELYKEVKASYTITVYRADQVAEFKFDKGSSDQTITYGEEYSNVANGGENSPVTYKSSDETVATVDANGKITALKKGETIITATNPQDDRYNKKDIQYKLIVERADQTITFANGNTSIPAITYGDNYQNIINSSKTAVTYTSSDNTIATVDAGGNLTLLKSGDVTITATAEQTEQYNEKSSSYSIHINKATQQITFEKGTLPVITFNDNGNSFINAATSDKGITDCLYNVTSGDTLITGFDETTGSFTVLGAGSVTVNVTFALNECYKMASKSYTLTVNPAGQSIAFPASTYTKTTGEDFSAPIATESGDKFGTGAITYSIKADENGVVKTIDAASGAITLTYKAGTVTVLATKASDANYNETTAEYSLTVNEWIPTEKNYELTGDKLNESGWFTGNVSINAQSGYLISYVNTNGDADWQQSLVDAVTTDKTNNSIQFYIKDSATGYISKQYTEIVKKDTVAPSASIEIESLTTWEKFLSIISFGTWAKDTADFTIISADDTSDVASIQYYVVENSTSLLNKSDLDAVTAWNTYSGTAISLDKDKVFVVYAKVTDTAGNYVYASTNGVVFDATKPDANISVVTSDSNGFYKGDVEVSVTASDAAPYSGINSITYKVVCNDNEAEPTQEGTLFNFTNANPEYYQLINSWDSNAESKNIIIDSIKNNSDNVKLYITVTDNAGNSETFEKSLKISAKDPTIAVDFLNDPSVVESYNGTAYYDTNRTAEITITGRTSVYADSLPKVVVTETGGNGQAVAEKTYTLSNWTTVEGATPDDATHTATISFNGSANYVLKVDYTDNAGHSAVQYTSDKFTVDHNNPTGTVTVDTNTWRDLIENLTFGLWKNEQVEVSATSTDLTSPVKSVEYYKSNDNSVVTSTMLDGVEWKPFTTLSISDDEQFTVYLKITDRAGHFSYISTNGYIVDMTDSTIDINPETANANGYYNDDVNVDITVEDASPYSGIDTVEYWVTCDGTETQREVLYDFNIINPTHTQLVPLFNDAVTVEAAKNNSDNVVIWVKTTDNAGNMTTSSKSLKIDMTSPTIDVIYDVNNANVVDGRGYFKTNRTATVVITERTTAFDATAATNGIIITAKNAKGELADGIVYSEKDNYIVDNDSLNIKWTTKEGTAPDDATHTATINYTVDANYTFEISYTDKADNANTAPDSKDSVAPYTFTVDKVNPIASVTVSTNTWDKLLGVLTFGLYSKNTVYVSATANDVTSPWKIEYYKTSDALQKTKGELDAVSTWSLYNSQIEINDDEQFVVYLKVTDNAGNYIYINSDGFIVDMTAAEILLTPEKPVAQNAQGVGIYNTDVNVLLDVNEQSPYAGLKKVEYWVLCNGKETQRDTLYSFEYVRDEGINNNGGSLKIYEDGIEIKNETGVVPAQSDLKAALAKTIKIDCVKNNSSDVVLHVGVTDNADNYDEKTLPVDIDITDPTISVSYDNNNVNKTENENGYFSEERTATVVITERTAHFDGIAAKAGIKITAKDINGKTVIEDCSTLIGDWVTKEPTQTEIANGATPDNATHTATIQYSADANYTFEISYTGIAGNKNAPVDTGSSVTPYSFTVDKTAPIGTVTVGGLGTWDKLIEILTFGLWSRDTVSVSGTTDDATSPIESIDYYKTADTTAKTEQDLNGLVESSWQEFKGFDVPASEQFTVYIRIVDYAGNVTYISTNGVIVDNVKPVIETVKPEITITPEQPVNGFYNSNVKVAVKVEDPKTGTTNAYAGIKEIRYEVLNMGTQTQQGILYSFDITAPTQAQLLQVWEKNDAIVVDKTLNNSNDVVIKVYAVDNAGNPNDNSVSIKIDITNPTIKVSYDNNDGDTTFTDGTYFKANRTATIVVRERNFDPEKVVTTLANEHGVIPELSGWTKTEGTGNGDDTLHTATIVYSADGDYTFDVKCADVAGNGNDTVDYGNSLAPQTFTLDKTLPLVSVAYDNNEASNGNYYKAQRVATITVTEHNFETSRVKVALKATDNGQASTLPAVGEWSSNGDVHTLRITYIADSLYTFDFDYNDKAGNATVDMAEQSFYVDKTNPTLSITKIVDESANNDEGNIGFVISATDTNFDVFTPVLTAVVKNGETFETKKLDIGSMTDIANGRTYTVSNIDADGIYRITCTVVDKAGNAYSQVSLTDKDGKAYTEERSGNATLLTFSVNRNGSTFEVDEKTTDMVEKYYVQNVEENVTIVEINADPLKEYKATLNGKDLKKDEDYKVTETGGNGDWMKYTYVINKSLFEKEGEYKIVVFSKDKAENDAFSDVKDATVNFVVDRTAPVVTVTGLATNGRYQVEKQIVTLIPTDDGGALKSLVVRMVDEDGKEIKELVNLDGKALTEALETGSGKIVFEIAEGLYQNVQILCNDCAVDADDKTNTYDETFTNVSVSSNAFMIFWANKPLRWASIGGVVLLTAGAVTLAVLKKKKKSK